ncbi:hypothetical protein ACFSTA_19215 [Ornithinibacillus salinisoli]|uniref:Uncharacterized protein n=1 Tax=Ornithinibacillus salinisoli TaxID=1848459 RepID=A0ABW4W4K6_9BACI
MYSLKFWVFWVIGVILAGFLLSLFQNGEVDWGHIVTMSIAGLIGVLIASGIKKVLKKEDD